MRFLKPLSFATLVAVPVLGATLATSCVENKSSIYIHSALYVPPDCAITAGPDEDTISRGRMDIAFDNGYTVALLIGNQLTPLGDQDSLRTETARFAVKGYEVHLMSGDLSSEITAFTQVSNGTVSPGESDPGFAAIYFEIIPRNANVRAGSSYVANIRVFGETLGGVELETAEFGFPVDVINGGFVRGLDEDGNCDPTADFPDGEERACFPGQGPTNCAYRRSP